MIRLLTGDALATLKTLPDESVHCVVTSPPYWGLRDYGVDGQMGLERSLGEHIERVVAVFRQVHRVLRKDGTLWLNYGDSYAASPNGRAAKDIVNDDRTFRDKPFSTIGAIYNADAKPRWTKTDSKSNKCNPHAGVGSRIEGFRPGCSRMGKDAPLVTHRNRDGLAGFNVGYLKPKDLCGIPWRVAFALQDDGWYLRQDIIWSKPNPMPESVRDRCTKAHEYIFLLSKSERYWYDADAILEDIAAASVERLGQANLPNQSGSDRVPGKTNGAMKAVRRSGNKERKDATERGCPTTGVDGSIPWQGSMRNKRSVWTICTQPFAEAHFATFPPELVKTCILAGCPIGGMVLDPFGGAGTTGLVADRLERNAILIELNPKYVEIAEKRIRNDAPLFVDLTSDTDSNYDSDSLLRKP